MITQIKRILNGSITKSGFKAAIGIPQGDPLGMPAAAALLGEWTRGIPHHHLLAKVFVDGRLMLSNNNQKLPMPAKFWDGALEFQSQAKTVAMVITLSLTICGGLMLMRLSGNNSLSICEQVSTASDFYRPTLQKCCVALSKIARSLITHDNAITIVARKILPAICSPGSVVSYESSNG